MGINVRPITRSDIPQVVRGWNASLPYDWIAEETFANTVFDDPDYEKEGNLVAVQDTTIVGLVAAVAREGIAGRDGAGTPHEKDFGYIKGLFVLTECDEAIKRPLLTRALEFLKSRGKKIARVGEYTGPYFFPGIDERYKAERNFYRENGFEEFDDEEDVAVDLKAFEPTQYQGRAKERAAGIGVVIEPYQPEFVDRMRRFVERLNMPAWFPAGWELELRRKHHHLVAVVAPEVVGWARFFKAPERWWFGPIAVLDEFRRKGIGTCLLLEAMLRMKALGIPEVTAGWANVPFYLKSGWQVSRRYIVLQKAL